ncbi:MAG: hypothetical protein OXC15_07155 [Rhodospirillaceae bacterium]|nr:hypothetical protein [Rhodospirillaceae bacterium]
MAKELPLKRALAEVRLEAFIAQAEKQGRGVADESQFDAAIAAVLNPHQSEDHSSHFLSNGDSTGT